MHPQVSVILPVYNGEKYLGEAIDSLLKQTYTDFELLIICEPSPDNSLSIAQSYTDKRCCIIQNRKRLGLVGSLNKGIRLAKGKYIARMDCDDICVPERLEKQVNFLNKYKRVGICGTGIKRFGVGGECYWKPPLLHEEIKATLLFESALAHPTVMFRKDIFEKGEDVYSPSYKEAEDYELWVRFIDKTEIVNIDEYLVKYRVHSTQKGMLGFESKEALAGKCRLMMIRKMGFNPTIEEFECHELLSSSSLIKSDINYADCFLYAEKLLVKNKESNYFRQEYLENLLGEKIVLLTYFLIKHGRWHNYYLKLFLSKRSRVTLLLKGIKRVLRLVILRYVK